MKQIHKLSLGSVKLCMFFFFKGCVYLIRKDSKIDSKTTSIFSGFQNSYEYLFDFY